MQWKKISALLILIALFSTPVLGQEIPRNEYLTYVPLKYPHIVAQNAASVSFNLYGDRSDPNYRDVDPIDGIDDRRAAILSGLGARFGPIMIQNTIDAPMDFHKFMEHTETWNLYVDTWNLVGSTQTRLRGETIDLVSVPKEPCPTGSGLPEDQLLVGDTTAIDDCKLLALLDEFDPYEPQSEFQRRFAVENDMDRFKVLFFDFPGEGPESWKQEYEQKFAKRLKQEYQDYLAVYVHPYINEVKSNLEGSLGFEFVLQYYFFYPTNDGGNNHEGDWEHINVRVTPRSAVGSLLTAAQIEDILTYGVELGGADDPLVIDRIDYYLHEHVMVLDFSRPNVYLPREQWSQQLDGLDQLRTGAKWFWEQIRYRAYHDDEEIVLNTHPICFIGADNKGFDQILAKPGGLNRDSHATYPFPGLYKDVGPGGASEQILSQFDHRDYYREFGTSLQRTQPTYGRGEAVPFVTADRLRLVPDWERVLEPVRTDPLARRNWCWMVLPIRWGYPATESPFAGVVSHAETGNLAPMGPHYQGGWNRSGAASGFTDYDPHRFNSLFPMGLQDTFHNSWGFLNLTLPMLSILPPLDMILRVALLPIKAVVKRQDPVFFPKDNIPFRFVSVVGAGTKLYYPDETVNLLFTGEHGLELLAELYALDPDLFDTGITQSHVEQPVFPLGQLNLFMGRRFATQNSLTHGYSDLGLSFFSIGSGTTYEVTSRYNFWELGGSFRYNLRAGDLQPYLKLGYGWTWYRLEDIAIDGQLIDSNTSEWYHKPSFDSFSDLLPNSFNYGFGLEYVVVKSYAPLLKGIDLGLMVEYYWTRYELGQDLLSAILQADDTTAHVSDLKVTRGSLTFGLTVGF